MSLVSVIIPAYNKSDYTCRTVDSVLAQTYPHIEILVVDDGSTDDTRRRMEAYGGRIRYIYKKNGGACSARNEGIRQAKGEYLAFLDCDDLYLPAKIELSVKYLTEHPEAGFVHTKAYTMDRDDKTVGVYERLASRRDGWIAEGLIMGNFICNSTVVARRRCIDQAGLFDETIFMPADWDMWLRLAEQAPAGYIDEPLTKYRITDNYVFNNLERSQREEVIVIDKYFHRNAQARPSKNKILSNLHMRFSQCYVLKDDGARVREELKQALAYDPWNIKAWTIRLLKAAAHARLKAILHRRILRTP
jgi:glycosyltransferase involved in cell wall biosynthesis